MASITTDLASTARNTDLETMDYLLKMVQLEAEHTGHGEPKQSR